MIGPERLAWASDFPHVRNPYPRSRESLLSLLADSSPHERELMAGQNVRKIYRIEV